MNQALKVLIVDDDLLIREMLRLIISEAELIVCGEAGDSATTRQLLKENLPNVVLLDIVLAGDDDGLDLLYFIKKEYPEIHVIMVSGEPSSERVQTAISNGACGFIVKPFNAQNVMTTFKRLIPTQLT
ncbi:MAG: response regulator [Thiohalomonadales bacterium]